MHIDRLEIKGFGKLTGRNISLKKGLNIIYGNNEAGKSTLQWFIKGMLYGLKGSNQPRAGWLQPRKRFLPWGGGPYGGALEYVLDDGSICRVERDFDKDQVKLFDSHFNDITDLFDKSRDKQPAFAGKQLGMDEAVFERTVFIKQLEVRLDEDSAAALSGRLANAGETGSEEISLSRAEKALTEALRKNVGTSRTTTQPLDRLEAQLRQLESERAKLQKQQELRNSTRNDLLKTKSNLGRLETEIHYLEQIGELIEIRRMLDLSLKQENGLKDATRRLKELEAAMVDTESVYASADLEGKSTGNRLNSNMARRHRGSIPLLYLSAAALFTILLAYSILSSGLRTSWLFTIVSGVGILFTGAAAFLAKKNNRFSQTLHMDPFNNETNGVGADNTPAGRSVEIMAQIKSICSDASMKCGMIMSNPDAVRSELKEITLKLNKLSSRLEEGIEEAVRTGAEAESTDYFDPMELDRVLYDNTVEGLTQTWKNEMDVVRKKALDAALKEKYYEGLLEDRKDDNDEPQRVEEETVAVREKIAYLRHRGNALKLAHQVLLEAGLEIRHSFAPSLDSRMSSIITGLTAGKYVNLKGDDKLALKVAIPESGDIKNVLALSGAAADQMYLALRLAMAEILTVGSESLPLVMDEVFSQFDDNRTALALKYLGSTYENGQVLILTCKQREVELAKEICGDRLNLVEL